MSCIVVLLALALLMFVTYRGYSVILFAPVCALLAILATDPSMVLPVFSGVFMDKTVAFIRSYLPVFLLGAVFGKVIEISGFSQAMVAAVIRRVGRERGILAIVVVCAVLTYGGVSLFVVVFAVYPVAAELFRRGGIPKRLIPGAIALGAFTFTMGAAPGSPQIQNVMPTTFFRTDVWAAPWLGLIGSAFILAAGLYYLELRRRKALAAGEGYAVDPVNEPVPHAQERIPNAWVAFAPLLVIAVANKLFMAWILSYYGETYSVELPGSAQVVTTQVSAIAAVWAIEGALLLGILAVAVLAFREVRARFSAGSKTAVAGALVAAVTTAYQYGFGGVIAALPGFAVITEALKAIPGMLINQAIMVTALAGITGSAVGGMSIALAGTTDSLIAAAEASGVPLEVLHRIAAMASGGMDTLPHNGAVIALLTVAGLTHRDAYGDIFAMTLIKTAAVFLVIGVFYMTGIY